MLLTNVNNLDNGAGLPFDHRLVILARTQEHSISCGSLVDAC